MTEREALMLALKALQSDDYWTHVEAVNAIHKTLAQPEQKDEKGRPMTYWGGLAQPERKPVAYNHKWDKSGEKCVKCGDKDWMGGACTVPDTTQPQRTWVGLTDDEIALINADYPHPQGFARALEAKLKEKNT